jgi:hypothetical protein
MNRGDIETRMQLTGRLLFQPAGDTGYINFGDLAGHTKTVKREGAQVEGTEKGFHRAVRNFTALVAMMWDFKLREQTKLNMAALQYCGGVFSAATTQSALTAPTGTASFTAVKQGRSYVISGNDLNTVVVTVSAVQKTEGVDYTVDLGSGELTILVGGGIADGVNVSVTYGQSATPSFDQYIGLWTPGAVQGASILPAQVMTGAVKFFEFDQHVAAGVQRKLHTFTGQLWFEGDEQHDGKKPVEPVLKVMAIDKPTIQVLK